jgi:hypothetical protein
MLRANAASLANAAWSGRLQAAVFFLAAATITACAARNQAPVSCCAAPGYSRGQVESVLGKPAPPQSSRWHPFPSPPPNAPVYTTEHGYVNVTYAGPSGLATRFSLDFYEGKAPDEAFRIASMFLPEDATDTGTRVVGAKASIRLYRSAKLARTLPASRGMLYVECTGPQPALMCEKLDIVLGSP